MHFDNRGYLTPYKVIPATIDEMKEHFVVILKEHVFTNFLYWMPKQVRHDSCLQSWGEGGCGLCPHPPTSFPIHKRGHAELVSASRYFLQIHVPLVYNKRL